MSSEPPFTLADPERAREEAQQLFEAVSQSLAPVLPRDADAACRCDRFAGLFD
jgi:hypothetical protein